MSSPNKLKRTFSVYEEDKPNMNREVTTKERGSPILNRKSNQNIDDNLFIMGRTSLLELEVLTLQPLTNRNFPTTGGRHPYSTNKEDEAEDEAAETGSHRLHPPIHRLAPLQRAHKSTGGVRVASTPPCETFPPFEDQDTMMFDLQTPGSSFETPQSSFRTPQGRHMLPQGRKRGSTNVSLTPWSDRGEETSRFSSFATPTRQEESTDDTRNGAPPTRQQVLAFIKAEIDALNTSKSEAKSKSKPFVPFSAPTLLDKVRNRGFDDVPDSAVGEEYDGTYCLGEVNDLDGTDEREERRENEMCGKGNGKKKEKLDSPARTPAPQTRLRRSTRRSGAKSLQSALEPPIFPSMGKVKASAVLDLPRIATVFQPPKNLINFTTLLQTHLDAIPMVYAEYPTLRLKPWTIITLRERLPPIEWNAAFRLKLDLFVACMDWLHLKKWGGLVKDETIQLLQDILNKLTNEEELFEPVGVLVSTIRVERVIAALQTTFSDKKKAALERKELFPSLVKPAFPPAVERMSHLRRSGPDDLSAKDFEARMRSVVMSEVNRRRIEGEIMSKERCRIRLGELERVEGATCLLTWLWFLEGVPEEVVAGVDLKGVKRVFRGSEKGVVRLAGAVILVGEQ